MLERLPKFTKNFYFLFGTFFVVWMLFFDSNDIVSQFKLRKKLKDLEQEKQYYLKRKEEVEKDRKELLTNQELLEKFAREKYLMKKESEEIFIVIEEE
ncbi:septum formation initiator family protein [Fulvivirgaceae bacterium BMA10]|uniref:Septum formation initiator family protein n=1 Tax=Splendidivirga corallicola TaxID=3051826 RepID=A0ABT8KYW5_9BACT|nr:septum formation initiator family protein [Fulvivirgaceae bacterium BMA10]